jgi:hypothetical protein
VDSQRKALSVIHDDKSLVEFVIPGLTRNPVFSWIPAFAGMTPFAAIYVAVYKTESISFDYYAMLYALCALRV